MKHTIRFDLAIKKLYTAFHNNSLYPECSQQCAVGTILDGRDMWKHLSDAHGSSQLNYIGKVHELLGRKFNGYAPSELLQIERTFLKACGYTLPLHHKGTRPENPQDKDLQFKGMCSVVELLCNLDGIKNVMDYAKLFEIEKSMFKKEKKIEAL